MVVFLLVLAGYAATLAPGVTFWDAGEFIAATKVLGVPHPPGTPLFVLLARVFASLVPVLGYAARTNLMTAMFSAGAAAWFFLVIASVSSVREGVLAALVSAFVFTVWQNSNETEVYMAATWSIAAVCWLAWLWRRARGSRRATHLLLLMAYIGAVSIGNHLLTLLVGPALVVFVGHTVATAPLNDPEGRRREWSELWVLATAWWLLVAVGLGSSSLLLLGALCFVAATVYAVQIRRAAFPAVVLLVMVVGISSYLFLYIRAGLHPLINEADPSTWDRLLAVVRRAQYPPRSPLDDPTYPSGPTNPGRTPELLWLQVVNFAQYFDWQWANGLATGDAVFAKSHHFARLPFTALFLVLGVIGARALYLKDRAVFWMLSVLFVTTGPVLLVYMNFKPGFTLGWDRYTEAVQHEVRERDYFYTVAFQVWGLLAGLGIGTLAARVGERAWRGARHAGYAISGLALLPFALNFTAASRSLGPSATLPRDFAYDLLESVDPYGVLITDGDNDTFPLWYLQEVEGIRQDVTVVNLSLANTDWYLRQLRDNPVRPFVAAQAPWLHAPAAVPPPVLSWSDADIAGLQPLALSEGRRFEAGRVVHEYPARTPFYVKDLVVLRLIQENTGRRPIFFAVTAGSGSWRGLDSFLTQEGLVLRLNDVTAPDSARLGTGITAVPIDVPRTDSLAWHVYRYAGLLGRDALALDATDHTAAADLSYPFFGLGITYGLRGDSAASARNLNRALHLRPDTALARRLREFIQLARLEASRRAPH